MNYLSVKETASRFGLSERRVQKLCESGRINGAQMISNVWVIPDTASKPSDERFSIEIDDMLSLSDACKELSISIATGRNWVKLGKLHPDKTCNRTPYFKTEYINNIKSEIINGKNDTLKSRRNKKFVSGNNIYRSYISETSKNISAVQSAIDKIKENNIILTDTIISVLIVDCAIKLLFSKMGNSNDYTIENYLAGMYSENKYFFLIDDLLDSREDALSIIDAYPELFSFQYIYEKDEDILGLLYISLKNLGSRKATGSYYTPTRVVNELCDNLFSVNSSEHKSILDPCCGTGNFILQLPESITYDNVYGNDIDKTSVRIARFNYALKFEICDPTVVYQHITEHDYLSYSSDTKYDFIIGNPPWGYEYTEAEKKKLKQKYSCAVGTNVESYDIFVEQAFNNLRENGVLSFVLPEAFLNVKTHAPIRSILLQKSSVQYISLLGNAFDKVQCPCVILQVQYTDRSFSTIGTIVNNRTQIFKINTERKVDATYFSFDMTDEEYRIINKIHSSTPYKTLANQAIFALGIVTGNNKAYISSVKSDDNEIIIKGADLCKYKFHPSNNYIKFEPDQFQQIAPTEYYRASEKLLYRFICSQLVFAYDSEQTLSLNSCNILIPQIPGMDIKYILAVLNSRIAQFYFRKNFNSVKILRSHIEQIPIPDITFKEQKPIINMVNALLKTSISEDIIRIYNEIDMEIAELFKLTIQEYNLIKALVESENQFLY